MSLYIIHTISKINFNNENVKIKKNVNYDLFLNLIKPLKENFEDLNKGKDFKIEQTTENTILISIFEINSMLWYYFLN